MVKFFSFVLDRFLLTPPASFSLGDPTVCPFAVIYLSRRYNSMLRPVSPSESPNVAAASGTPDTGEPKRKMGTKWKSNKNCLHPKQESVCAILMGYLGYKSSENLGLLQHNSHGRREGAGLGEGGLAWVRVAVLNGIPERRCRESNPQRTAQHPRRQARPTVCW